MIECYSDCPLLVIAGPTASGKSKLALTIATKFSGIIINSDSMQVYSNLRILTSRPSVEEEFSTPHKLYGIIPAEEPFSVGRWREKAVKEIELAWAKNFIPIIVGGTGFYINRVDRVS